jgi:RNA polymerase sigma factor (sigma-70 family)
LTDENVVLFDLKFLAEHENHEHESDELRIEALRKILETISPQKREMLFLKFSTGLNYAEIGEIVEMKADAVKKQVYRTLDDLRDRFGDKLLSLFTILIRR